MRDEAGEVGRGEITDSFSPAVQVRGLAWSQSAFPVGHSCDCAENKCGETEESQEQ